MVHEHGRTISVHRAAWLLSRGAIPEGMSVCHSCDVPTCCNPAHLWLGSPSQNMRDCVAKGRHSNSRRPVRRPRTVQPATYARKVANLEVVDLKALVRLRAATP